MKPAVTISGSFQKSINAIREDIKEFQRLGCTILSPRMFTSHKNDDGFVILDSDGGRHPAAIHSRHLVSIDQSMLLWVRDEKGYIGLSTALEIGYAHAIGLPVFAPEKATDTSLNRYIKIAHSPEEALQKAQNQYSQNERNNSSHIGIQADVAHMSAECGFDSETDQEILNFLDEEIAELKEAVSHDRIIAEERHSMAEELADCAIYLYHLANQSGINLYSAVKTKIGFNLERWGRKRGAA